MTEPEPNFNARTEVYAGRTVAGAFARNARGFVAADAAGKRLGEYPSRQEAIAAIMQARPLTHSSTKAGKATAIN